MRAQPAGVTGPKREGEHICDTIVIIYVCTVKEDMLRFIVKSEWLENQQSFLEE